VIFTFASGAFAAKAATTTIPIAFVLADDPVRLGLVTNIARPSGNLTGINFLNAELGSKRLDFLRQLVPTATRIVLLGTQTGAFADAALKDTEMAARAAGLQIRVVKVSTSQEIDAVFGTFAHERPDALFVSPDPFFRSRRVQLTHLATRHTIPATYALRDYCDVGGLMSYGASLSDAHRQAGVYVGRILKGAKPADLPVVQASKFELVINAQAARILGLTVPPSLLAIADEVIE
jgi:putative tryptophan/tyrosine transport system substrate-binding protein